jgi:MFS family permease
MSAEPNHKTRTLCLAGVLHAFTHLYQVALLPLYLPIQADLKLQSVGQVTLLVSIMMIAYYLPSYPMGMLADRVSRKKLLCLGLGLNALGFIGLSFARTYPTAVAAVIIAGVGGSSFHPAATAMIARLFPVGTGRALGLFGMGASIGFCFGPIYAGWRAETAGWRAPVLELGLLGLVGALVFATLADEAPSDESVTTGTARPRYKMFPGAVVWAFFIAASLAFSLRDFAGSSMGSLSSLFLQKAHGFDLRETGLTLSVIFLASLVSNPLFGHLSDKARFRWAAFVMCVAAVIIAVFPLVPRGGLIPAFMLYGFFFMSSYPMVEAALMESVPDAVRGRVFGFFITIGGMIGNLSHGIVGHAVEGFGAGAGRAESYHGLFGTLALLCLLSLVGLPCLHAIRKREHLDSEAVVSSPQTRLSKAQFE